MKRRYITVAETAEYLQASPKTVRRLITDGELTRYRMGSSRRTIRVDLNEVDEQLMRPLHGPPRVRKRRTCSAATRNPLGHSSPQVAVRVCTLGCRSSPGSLPHHMEVALTGQRSLLGNRPMLGAKTALLEKLGQGLPRSFTDDLVNKRNKAVHRGWEPTSDECESAIREALAQVERVFRLPTPPGADSALVCRW
ncbi:helix-turn-helix domain-containing protein [Mycobacterium paragordonae]|uniref:helix-turn-helix domain-containing protein n=1 Tax=Mycobacterium paragordonae TaxID=1389713 RepID=UPI002803DDDC|nr:helix-turn-helix domain-containing protein [Mycobacterium paragordonae]